MTVDDINLLQRHEILAQLESLVTNGVDADFKATLRRVKRDCGWNESQKLSAALGSAILRFLYKCPKASAFEDAHFYALQKTGIRFTNREDAREFFYIISEAKFKATKQDEMASKALFVQGHPDSERIPPSCVAPQRTNDDTTRKSTRDSSKKPAGKGKETSNNSQKRKSSTDSEDVVPRRGTSMKNPSSKKTKCEHKSASKTPAPGSRTTRNSSGGRSSTGGKSGGSSGKKSTRAATGGKTAGSSGKRSQASSGGRSSNGGSHNGNGQSDNGSSNRPVIKEEKDDIVKQLTFEPITDPRFFKLFSFDYQRTKFNPHEKPIEPFKTLCTSLTSFPHGQWFVKPNDDGEDAKPMGFITLHREFYMHATCILGIRVVNNEPDWLPERDYVITPEHGKLLELLLKQYVPYELFNRRLVIPNFNAKSHVKHCNTLGEWYEAFTNKMSKQKGFVYVAGCGAEVKRVAKNTHNKGCVIFDHFVLHRMISKNEFIEDLTGLPSDDENTHTSSYLYESESEEELEVEDESESEEELQVEHDDSEKDSPDGEEGSDAEFELEAEVVKGKGDY
jgi:hypothetical protein